MFSFRKKLSNLDTFDGQAKLLAAAVGSEFEVQFHLHGSSG